MILLSHGCPCHPLFLVGAQSPQSLPKAPNAALDFRASFVPPYPDSGLQAIECHRRSQAESLVAQNPMRSSLSGLCSAFPSPGPFKNIKRCLGSRGSWNIWIEYVIHSSTSLCSTIIELGDTPWKNLEKKMATHCSVPAWRIPWAEESGGLLPMGWHRVGHDWSNLGAEAALKRKGANSVKLNTDNLRTGLPRWC